MPAKRLTAQPKLEPRPMWPGPIAVVHPTRPRCSAAVQPSASVQGCLSRQDVRADISPDRRRSARLTAIRAASAVRYAEALRDLGEAPLHLNPRNHHLAIARLQQAESLPIAFGRLRQDYGLQGRRDIRGMLFGKFHGGWMPCDAPDPRRGFD